jgi:myosin heavy subunit
MARGHALTAGAAVWIPCSDTKKAAFVPGSVLDVGKDGKVTVKVDTSDAAVCDSGKEVQVADSAIRPRFDRLDGGSSADSTALTHMNDASILENLRIRHKQNDIYTYTASVLLAMNPYKWSSGLYEPHVAEEYRGKHIGALPPHPFAIADSAHRMLNREEKNQAILISGESGAGKTETAKIVMKYIAHVSGTGSDTAQQLQSRVSQAQPILESLGNAATLRNNNSSRFGKYNRIFFNNTGALADASITTYLLESSRVVAHAEKERNYHVFYEMLAGLSDEKLAKFHLVRGQTYRLLHSMGRPVEGFAETDTRNFTRLQEALATVGLDEAQIEGMFQVLAGLVHLAESADEDEQGMPRQTGEDEKMVVEVNVDKVQKAAELLGFDADELAGTLRRKRITVPGRKSLHEVSRTPAQFRQAVTSLIKAIYKRLFEQIVDRINRSFKEDGQIPEDESERRHIGILDIYGFERLQRNSFEQLCINLANERLQQYFVENVLVAEQNLYRREALPWTDLAIPDSKPVVGCVSQVFTTLDDFSSRLARGLEKDATDERFCEKVTTESEKDVARRDVLKKPRVAGGARRNADGPGLNEGFTIKHYAGTVDYNTRAWLDKNNDRLLQECEDLISDSTFAAVKSLGDDDKAGGNTQRSPFRSISKRYQQDLEALLQTLGTCNLHCIRCFKPNEEQKAGLFKGQLVLDQLVQCGTIELVKIMHDGYPNRCPLNEITDRFRGMLPENFQRYGNRTFIEALMMAYKVPAENWALGMSRLFLKAGQLQQLEDMRAEGAAPDPEELARIVSGIIRKRWSKAGHAVRFCNYVPKLIREIHVNRAAKALSVAALVTGKLALRLEAAKTRVAARKLAARRKLRGCFLAVRFMLGEMRRIRAQRKERVEKALYMGTLIVVRTRWWVAKGRERAVEAQSAREMEQRRLEDERKRLEEQRRKFAEEAELRKAEEEARKEQEEELRRQEAEERRKEDEQRRVEEEKERESRRLEEERLIAETRARREAEEEEYKRAQEKRQQDERDRLEEDRKRFDEERAAFEKQKSEKAAWQQKENSILASASPFGGRRCMADASTVGTDMEDDISPGDSVSVAVPTAAPATDLEMRLKMMEEEFARKQSELQRQMLEMQAKNQELEKMINDKQSTDDVMTQSCDKRDRLLTASSSAAKELPMTPPGGPMRSPDARSDLKGRLDCLGARVLHDEFASVIDSRTLAKAPTGSPSGPRASVAGMGDNTNMGLGTQRKWWTQQREHLLEDLYGSGM